MATNQRKKLFALTQDIVFKSFFYLNKLTHLLMTIKTKYGKRALNNCF